MPYEEYPYLNYGVKKSVTGTALPDTRLCTDFWGVLVSNLFANEFGAAELQSAKCKIDKPDRDPKFATPDL